MTSRSKDIFPLTGAMPFQSGVLNGIPNTLSGIYEQFFTQITESTNEMLARGLGSLTLNPDFNYTRTKGTTPTTQADGDDAEFVEQWNVTGSGGGNAYTLTPTAYASTDESATGSKFFVNFSISSMPSAPITIYNVNYSSDFNTASQYQNRPITFSARITSNTTNRTKIRFAVVTDITSTLTEGNAIYLESGVNKISSTIQMPTLSVGAGQFSQIQLRVEDLGGTTSDFDLHYLKAEFGRIGSDLLHNQTVEKLKIDNL